MAAHVQASVQAVQKKAVPPSAKAPPAQPGPAPHVRAAVQRKPDSLPVAPRPTAPHVRAALAVQRKEERRPDPPRAPGSPAGVPVASVPDRSRVSLPVVLAKPAPPRPPVSSPLPGRVPPPPPQPVSAAVQCGKSTRTTRAKKSTKAPLKAPKRIQKPKIQKPRKQRRSRYGEGTHGFKKKEQARLNKLIESGDLTVSGSTYESEHTIGYAVLVLGADNMKRGKSSEARQVENSAPAYQEVKELHRDHIGTGSRGYDKDVGFSANSYRDDQRRLIEADDVSSAVQINQLGYAFDPNLRELDFKERVKIATLSFDLMVSFMSQVGYIDGEDKKTAPVTPKQKAEMYLARRVAITGRFPTVEEENEARKLFGIKEIEEKKQTKDSMEIEEL